MPNEKDFIIGFMGTDNFTTIKATSLKDAKKTFADLQGVRMSSYITTRKKAKSAKDKVRNHIFR